MRMFISALSLFLGLFFAYGCTVGEWRSYPGPQLPTDQVAVLYTSWSVWTHSVDAEELPKVGWEQTRNRWEMLPGQHNIKVSYNGPGKYTPNKTALSFTAEGGHKYRLVVHKVVHNYTEFVTYNIIDVTHMSEEEILKDCKNNR